MQGGEEALTMHRLVPRFILDQMVAGQSSGQFHAVCLFVDVSGFTPLATALMEYSTEGAEVLAQLLSSSFEPLIDIIYAHHGFVATFAGDAFIALFPTDTALRADVQPSQNYTAHSHAVIAGWKCSQFIQNNPKPMTRFGEFSFAIRVSLADGMVDWHIWQSEQSETNRQWQQRAAYSFSGEAIDRCFAADVTAVPGSIVLSSSIYHALPVNVAACDYVEPYYHLKQLAPTFFMHTPAPAALLPPLMPTLVGKFFPTALLQSSVSGEFRQVVSVYINLAALPTGQAWVDFQAALFERLAQYGGYLCEIGRIGHHDSVCTLVIYWGVPTSFENNLTRALQFALDLRASAPVSMRIGITHHLAYTGFIGSTHRTEYTCYGVHVALAARQMTSASWGEIIVDEATASQAKSDFQLADHGKRLFKGFLEERPIYLLQRRLERLATISDRQPLIGREREIAELHRLAAPILRGEWGGIVLIAGEAGIGKSRLLREFYQIITATDDTAHDVGQQRLPDWQYCRTDEIHRQPLQPFRYLLRRYFAQSNTEDLQSNQQHFTERFEALQTATVDSALVHELTRLRPVLAALIELPWDDPFYQQLEPELRLENLLNAVETLLKVVSRRRPLIIQVEDAHWLDAESRLFLERLVSQMADYPLLLLLTIRHDEVGEKKPGHSMIGQLLKLPHTLLQLQPLSKFNLRKLATALLDGPVTQSIIDRLETRAKGNPFFAEQMLLHWKEQDLLRWGDQGLQFETASQVPFEKTPSTLSPDIRTLLTARLDSLSAQMRTVIQTAAVLGDEFDHAVLAYLLQQDGLPIYYISLVEREGIWHANGAHTYQFHHTLLSDAAYGMQSHRQIQKLHLRAAAAIETVHEHELRLHYVELVYHYHQGSDYAQERHYAQVAGKYAADNYLNFEAVRFYSRALELTAPHEWEQLFELYAARSAVYQWLGQRKEQNADIQQQVTLAQKANHPQWLAEAKLQEADFERTAGNYSAAIECCQQVLQLSEQNNALMWESRAYHTWGVVLRHQGHHGEAQEKLQLALFALQQAWEQAEKGQQPGLSKTEKDQQNANSLYEIGHLYYVQGLYEEAASYYSRAEAIYKQTDDKKGQTSCLLMFAAIYHGKGRFAEAERIVQEALQIVRALGWRAGETSCLSNLGSTYFEVGDYLSANYYHTQALQLWRQLGDREGEAISLDTLALTAHQQGQSDLAEEYYHHALAIQEALGDQHGAAYTQTHLGHTLLATKRISAAIEQFERALAIRRQLGEEGAALDSLAGLALAQYQAGQSKVAQEAIMTVVEQLAARGIDGLEFPIQVYLICYELLSKLAVNQPEQQTLAQELLQTGYQLVQQRAEQISNPKLHSMFLEQVPVNRAIIAHMQSALQQR